MKYIDRQILNLAIPSIISNITVPLLGMIDVAITGHIGNKAFIGAIAVGGILFDIIYWLFGFLRMGTSGMTAQSRGARHFSAVSTLLRQSLTVAFLIGIILIVLQWPIREFALYLISPEESVANLTRIYFNICIWGTIPTLSLFALFGWFIGMQNTRIPMFISILQNVLNIICSLLLVFVFGMKIEGVAIGTVVAQWTGFLIAILILRYFYYKHLQKLSAAEKCHHNLSSKHSLKRFFTINKDIFLRTCCLVAIHFFFISSGAKQRTVCLAVNTILMQLFTLYSYFLDGFAYAGEALVGKTIGNENKQQLQSYISHLFMWGIGIAALFTVVYMGWGRSIVSLFTDSNEVLSASNRYWKWIILFPICGMAAFIWDGIYCGATTTKGMLISVFVSMVVFFMLYYAFAPVLANHALWLAFVVYLASRGIMQTILWFIQYCKTAI